MNIDGTYIKDLAVFLAVVDANGISNAQSILNKDASTISRSIGTLETRLGLKLCERGRQGFELTAEGKVVHEEALKLFSSLRTFQNQVEGVGGQGAGRLALGIIDNVITDPNCHISEALGKITSHYSGKIHIDLHVKNPYELETYLLDKRIDIALGIFESRHDGIFYQPLYEETDYLYCAPTSPIATLIYNDAPEKKLKDALKLQNFCARNFLNEVDIQGLGFQVLGTISYTANLEAIALLVLSGTFIGFMPQHYAQKFVNSGQLIAILPESLVRVSSIQVAHRKREEQSRELIRNALNILKTT